MIRPADQNSIQEAAKLIRESELVAFPTETVYGLGANAFDEVAVQKIFAAKGRPAHNPLIVHIADFESIAGVATIPPASKIEQRLQLLRGFWPGPLSVVLPRTEQVAPSVCAGLATVAVRIPNHPVALALIKAAGVPIAAPSANPSNYISPTTAAHVEEGLRGKVRIILDGGSSEIGLESTIIDLCSDPVTLLRPGGISLEQLRSIFPDIKVREQHSLGPVLSPGLLKEHYSPRTPTILRGQREPQSYPSKVGLICFKQSQSLETNYKEVRVLSKSGRLEEVAAKLFACLRELDQAGLELIVVDTCKEIGLGRAIMDRLMRATAKFSG
ncbi:MAG: threonylcarbamoyl-AMP synthase [Oligoflexia bacterium]|nr:threonylcarbamoyl-AMP synthase [Oligoflexia bacterium]